MLFPSYKNKKVLIMGLGILGRGVNDAKFFAEAGARVTVTDLKSQDQLSTSLKELVFSKQQIYSVIRCGSLFKAVNY